jgi:hypothetical protein
MLLNGLSPDPVTTGGQMDPVVKKAGFGYWQALFGKGHRHIQKTAVALLGHIT